MKYKKPNYTHYTPQIISYNCRYCPAKYPTLEELDKHFKENPYHRNPRRVKHAHEDLHRHRQS